MTRWLFSSDTETWESELCRNSYSIIVKKVTNKKKSLAMKHKSVYTNTALKQNSCTNCKIYTDNVNFLHWLLIFNLAYDKMY